MGKSVFTNRKVGVTCSTVGGVSRPVSFFFDFINFDGVPIFVSPFLWVESNEVPASLTNVSLLAYAKRCSLVDTTSYFSA